MGHTKTIKPNNWKQHHDSLTEALKANARKTAMKALEWSEATFYRKMRLNENLKNYERLLICNAYGVEISFFFPESDLIKPAKKKAKAA